jgi:hypothetical protein
MEEGDPTLANDENWKQAQKSYLDDCDLEELYTEDGPCRAKTIDWGQTWHLGDSPEVEMLMERIQ